MKKLLVFAITLIVCFSVFAQKSDSTIINKKFKYIRFQPFQLIYNELVVNVELPISERFDISFGGGYIKNTNKGNQNTFGGMNGMFGGYSLQNYLNPFLQAYKIDLGIKKYLTKSRDYFLSFNPYYRKWWLDNTFLIYDNVEGYRFSAIRNERVHVIGAKLLFGSNFDLFTGKHFSFNMTPYLGIGYRYKFNHYESVGYVYETFYSEPYIEKSEYGVFTPQLGFMCGLGIR